MRTALDIQRSLQRYVALILPTYEIRMLIEQGTVERPYATIAETTPAGSVLGGTLSVRDITQAYSIVAFPAKSPSGDPYTARIEAAALEEAFWRAFQLGGIDGSRQMRIPLYDYDGKTTLQGSASRTPKDFIRVLDYDVRAEQAPTDEMLYSVVAALRCAWSRGGRLRESGGLVERVDVIVTPGGYFGTTMRFSGVGAAQGEVTTSLQLTSG